MGEQELESFENDAGVEVDKEKGFVNFVPVPNSVGNHVDLTPSPSLEFEEKDQKLSRVYSDQPLSKYTIADVDCTLPTVPVVRTILTFEQIF